jgi:hypothetical protein
MTTTIARRLRLCVSQLSIVIYAVNQADLTIHSQQTTLLPEIKKAL